MAEPGEGTCPDEAKPKICGIAYQNPLSKS